MFSASKPSSIPLRLKKTKTVQFGVRIREWRSLLACAPGKGERREQTKLLLGEHINWTFTGEWVISIEKRRRLKIYMSKCLRWNIWDHQSTLMIIHVEKYLTVFVKVHCCHWLSWCRLQICPEMCSINCLSGNPLWDVPLCQLSHSPMCYQTCPATKCFRLNAHARLTMTLPFHWHPIWWAHFRASAVIASQDWRQTCMRSLTHSLHPPLSQPLLRELFDSSINHLCQRGELQKLSIVSMLGTLKSRRQLRALTFLKADICLCASGSGESKQFLEDEEINK